MARFTSGWIKLHRGILEKDLIQNINLFAIWNYVLIIAVYKDSQIIWNGEQRILKPGSCVLGINALAEMWELSPRTISKWLHYLKKTGRIVLESCARGTIVTICNWEQYQILENDACAPTAHQLRTDCALTAHQVALNEEVKKGRKKKTLAGIRSDYPPIFVQFWDSYGKVGSKSKALKAFEKLKLTEADFEILKVSIKNYYSRKPDWKSPQDFSTFLNSDWTQYLESETRNTDTQIEGPRQKTEEELIAEVLERRKKALAEKEYANGIANETSS